MVIVFFRGGLGNQMFQYAAGLSLAKKYNTTLALDTVHVRDRFPRRNFTFRTFDLPEVFDVKNSATPLSRSAQSLPIPGVWLGLDLMMMNLARALGSAEIIYENEMKGFDSGVFEKAAAAQGQKKDIILYGRFENEKYFKDVDGDVRNAFRFKHPLVGDAVAVADEIAKTNSTSIHVRRGDFATSKGAQRVTGAIGLHYYERAIEYSVKHVSDPHFFIFSDDIAWCKANLPMRYPATYIEPGTSGPAQAFHLELMSRCKHHIIANSTFGWWCAWLNGNPNKVVIVPERWYSDGRAASNIVPEAWIKL